jgi:hypothetical protein
MRERTQGNEQCLLFTLAPRFSVLRAFANRQFDPEVVPPPPLSLLLPLPMSLLYTRPPRRRRPAPAQRIRVEEGGKKREGRRGREGERERGREGERERGSEGARERENLTVFGKLDFTPDACPTTKQAGPGKAKRAAESHPRNFCYLSGQGLAARKVASTHGTCPISTEGWTRRVHFVREGGGGGGGWGRRGASAGA